MSKLSDIQLLLLTTAAARPEGSLLPPPDRFADHQARVRRSILALIKIGMVEERPIDQGGHIWRDDGERPLGAFITQEGRIAIGEPLPVTPSPSSSKIDMVLALLRGEQGATLAELVEATGWLPHTTRAALTRLRQKGHGIDKATRDGATVYLIKSAA